MVAVLWAVHGLAPSETLSCPTPVLNRTVRILEERAEAEQKARDQQQFEADSERLHAALRGTGG